MPYTADYVELCGEMWASRVAACDVHLQDDKGQCDQDHDGPYSVLQQDLADCTAGCDNRYLSLVAPRVPVALLATGFGYPGGGELGCGSMPVTGSARPRRQGGLR